MFYFQLESYYNIVLPLTHAPTVHALHSQTSTLNPDTTCSTTRQSHPHSLPMSIPFICCCNQCCTVHTEWVGQLFLTHLPSSFTLPTLSQPLPLRCYYCTIAKNRGWHVRLPIPHSPPSTYLHHSLTHLPPHTHPTHPSLTHSHPTHNGADIKHARCVYMHQTPPTYVPWWRHSSCPAR